MIPQRGFATLQTVSEGEVLGWSWLLAPYRWRFGARTLQPTRALAFDGKCLRGKCEDDHDLGYELLKRFTNVVTERLEATRLQLLDLYGASS
jgi:CRP/FNR family cyclic AMP-dependent transcriptional regulator